MKGARTTTYETIRGDVAESVAVITLDADAPSATASAVVTQGHAGRKSGRGFYVHDAGNRTGRAGLVTPKGSH